MSKWPHVALEQIADISAGNPAPQSAHHYCAEGYPFVRMQDVGRKHIDPALVETTDRVSPLAVRECGLRLYPKGTLLIPKSGASVNLNHRAMLGQDAYVVSHFATIIPDQRKVLPSYLFHWSQRYDPRSQAQVTSLPSLPLSLIKAAKVPLPPLEEQRRIVALLDRAAEIRRRAEAARAKARAIIPALFLDMFGDPATNPKGWVTCALGDVASVGSGSGFPKRYQGQHDQSFPFLKVSDMNFRGNEIRIVTWNNSVSDELRRKLGAKAFPAGSIIFPKIGAAIATNKKRILTVPSCVDNNVMAVTFGDQVDKLFGLALFQTKNISDFASASDLPSIRKASVEEWVIPVPPLPLQTAFAEKAQRLEAAARALDAVVAKAEAMAAALLAEVFDTDREKETAIADELLMPC